MILEAAFKGALVLFGVTDYWDFVLDLLQQQKFAAASHSNGHLLKECEMQYNTNIINAVAKSTASGLVCMLYYI